MKSYLLPGLPAPLQILVSIRRQPSGSQGPPTLPLPPSVVPGAPSTSISCPLPPSEAVPLTLPFPRDEAPGGVGSRPHARLLCTETVFHLSGPRNLTSALPPASLTQLFSTQNVQEPVALAQTLSDHWLRTLELSSSRFFLIIH